nr:odorant receptor 19 [Graphosoma rubrolineatum]
MISGKKIKDFFYAKKSNDDMGFINNEARFLLTGISIWKTHSRFVIPSATVGFFGVLMLLSNLLYTILHYDSLNWINKIVDYGWTLVYLTVTYIIINNKEEIISLSEEVDRWWKYTYLEEEKVQLKIKSQNWMRTFNKYYVTCSTISWSFYVLPPVAKYFYKDRKQTMDALIFAAWTPFPLDIAWGYAITYGLEVLIMAFAQCLYSQLFLLLMTFAIVIGHQMRLIGTAFLTIVKRIDPMMKDITFETRREFYEVRDILLAKELRNGVRHFQHLYKCSYRLSRIFSSITNVTYHGGMWVMCSIAVKAATEMTFVVMLQAFMMISIVIISQYMYSFINECIIEEVQKLRNVVYDSPWYEMSTKIRKEFHIFQTMLDSDRFPTLRTIMGSQTNMENLSKVINASYCYFSMLITMKSRYETTTLE